MATFDNLPASKPVPRRARAAPVFCAGWRVFVHWPTQAPDVPVPLKDSEGKPLANDLLDGQQVEIVSWRPRSREGLVYQIRRLADDTEWWIEARYLRQKPFPEVVSEPAVRNAAR